LDPRVTCSKPYPNHGLFTHRNCSRDASATILDVYIMLPEDHRIQLVRNSGSCKSMDKLVSCSGQHAAGLLAMFAANANQSCRLALNREAPPTIVIGLSLQPRLGDSMRQQSVAALVYRSHPSDIKLRNSAELRSSPSNVGLDRSAASRRICKPKCYCQPASIVIPEPETPLDRRCMAGM